MRSRGNLFGVKIVELDLGETIPADAAVIPANTIPTIGALQDEIARLLAQNTPPTMVALVGDQPHQLEKDIREICGDWRVT